MSNDLSIISIKNLTNFVRIQETKTHIHIISNGIPIHRTGVFPGRGNPHSISEQRHDLKVSKNPQINMKTTQSRFFGVALNGVMFVPGTAECWEKREEDGVKGGLDHSPSLENHQGQESQDIWMIVSGEKKQLSTDLPD